MDSSEWIPVEKPPLQAGGQQFLTGSGSEDRVSIRYFRHRDSTAVIARVRFGIRTEGPPGHAHGGSISAVLDEAMGAAAWLAGYPVVTVELSVRFRKKVPIGSEAVVETELESCSRRDVRMTGRLIDESTAKVFATATGRFYRVDPVRLGVPPEVLGNYGIRNLKNGVVANP